MPDGIDDEPDTDRWLPVVPEFSMEDPGLSVEAEFDVGAFVLEPLGGLLAEGRLEEPEFVLIPNPVVPVAVVCPGPKLEVEIEELTRPFCDEDCEVAGLLPPVLPPALTVPAVVELNIADRLEEGLRRPFPGYSKFEIE